MHTSDAAPALSRAHAGHARSGMALVMTMIVLFAIVAAVSIASDRVMSARATVSLALARQRAMSAAESVAALVEDKLTSQANDSMALIRDLSDAKQAPVFWNLRGYCDGSTDRGGLYVNDCLVRWRMEPVAIYDQTLGSTIPSSAKLVVNADPANTNPLPANPQSVPNSFVYHYRIVTQAYALKDPSAAATAKPWDAAHRGEYACSVQVQRITQVSLISLFRFALFYNSDSPIGDIDFSSGTAVTVAGSVHSNGAIYLGGGFGYPAYDYHDLAAIQSAFFGGASAGMPSGSTIRMTGVGGVFRTSKVSFYSMFTANPTLNGSSMRTMLGGTPTAGNPNPAPNPFQIPLRGWAGWGGATAISNLNGDDDTYTNVRVNDVALTGANDSRTPTRLLKDFAGNVRDNNTGGARIDVLSQLPQLGAGNLESPMRVGVNAPLLFNTLTNAYTVIPVAGQTKPVYYASSAAMPFSNGPGTLVSGTQAVTTTVPAANPVPVYATELALYTTPTGATDVYGSWGQGSGTTPPPIDNAQAPGNLNTYLALNPVFPSSSTNARQPLTPAGSWTQYVPTSHHLRNAVANGNGLVVRERGARNTNWTYLASGASTLPPLTVPEIWDVAANPSTYIGVGKPYPTLATFVAAYQAYLEANYAVYYGSLDITDLFFTYTSSPILSASELRAKLIATEDNVVNRREGWWLSSTAYQSGNIGWLDDAHRNLYRQNLMTINWGVVQSFLRATPASAVGVGAGNLNDLYNGLFYIHRTDRAAEYHPFCADYPGYAGPGAASPLQTAYPWIGAGPVNLPMFSFVPQLNGYAAPLPQVGDPTCPYVKPSYKQVRLYNAKLVNYGKSIVEQSSPTVVTRPQGLTFATPDQLYLWGDVNNPWPIGTTPPATISTAATPAALGADPTYVNSSGAFRLTPMAIMADGVTALSNNWDDAQQYYFGTATQTGSTTRSAGLASDGSTAITAVPTTYCTSVVMNNVPTTTWDQTSAGAKEGASVVNNLRFLENWGGCNYNIMGSMVVMTRQRHSAAQVYFISPGGNNIYSPPARNIRFNTDLFTKPGTPPFTPFGLQVTRVISTVNLLNN